MQRPPSFKTHLSPSWLKKTSASDEAPKLVTVRVLVGAVGEYEGTFEKGETFQTTAERAAALGDSVELVK